mmetsp:Transcript_78662/g.220463  ORF Transcript_78662/g.220463 Transcript_78662/m.220463 type:complete len:229 (+) Transcript_78662:561-1247(+)
MLEGALLLLELALAPDQRLRLGRDLGRHEAVELLEEDVVLLLKPLGLHVEMLLEPLLGIHVRLALRHGQTDHGSFAHRVHRLLRDGLQVLAVRRGFCELPVQLPDVVAHGLELAPDAGVRHGVHRNRRGLRCCRGKLNFPCRGRRQGRGVMAVMMRMVMMLVMAVMVRRVMPMVVAEMTARNFLALVVESLRVRGGALEVYLIILLCGGKRRPTSSDQRSNSQSPPEP